MDHVAIMRKSWGLLPKILSGEKTIESRWYLHKVCPWGRIQAGETIYFKDSGCPVSLKATVAKILQFDSLTPAKIKDILKEYAQADGIEEQKIAKFFERFKDKKYCLLIFLKNPRSVEPFNIDKSGFGLMSAWLTIGEIEGIKTRALVRV